ncbi:hypothetical protein A3Q56_06412 [Intoshia linei]|uniref:Eukaryotic translation initiation factor 2 subunit 2 n=1 Tax=Intoshia linei TaxID=1819745 RepID=A0A177AV83_9BILA|nr:hypothetical protein A3Q56_06412 [Intoshia linei]
MADVDLTLLKKKKKKTKPQSIKITEKLNALQLDDDFDLSKHKKKKRTKPVANFSSERAAEAKKQYLKLLQRCYDIMAAKNPDILKERGKKFIMVPPQVAKSGVKKSCLINFTEICRLMKRQPKHVLAFLNAELGTTGSIDGSNQLIIKGRFQNHHIENVLRKYIKEYVTCHTCHSGDTFLELQKNIRLYFLKCNSCQSSCSVQTIKSGYQVVSREKRRADRNA